MRSNYCSFLLLLVFAFISPSTDAAHSLSPVRGEAVHGLSDSTLMRFRNRVQLSYQAADTTAIIKHTQNLIRYLSGVGRYQEAYDNAWNLLPLVEQKSQSHEKIDLFLKLSSLYIIFEHYDKADIYIQQAFETIDSFIVDETSHQRYTAMMKGQQAWLTLKATKDADKAKELILEKRNLLLEIDAQRTEINYTNLQLCNLYLESGRTPEAGQLLHTVYQQEGDTPKTIHALLFYYLGQYYFQSNDFDQSIVFLKKSIETIDRYNIHLDRKIDALHLLSDNYRQKKNYKLALGYLTDSKQLADVLFGSKSTLNKELFEIKDKYALRLQAQEQEIVAQRLELLERKNQVWFYQLFSYIGLSLIIIIVLLIYFWRQSERLRNEKALLKREQDFEQQKQNEVLEIKTKELMTRAMQMLERDNAFNKLVKSIDQLSGNDKTVLELKKMANSFTIDKSSKWKEFEAHFTTVNSVFFQQLGHKYPKLTATDLKFCAFIKLGFSSKEMSDIMAISADSVNTSRSRIRKKMALGREVNIYKFLQEL